MSSAPAVSSWITTADTTPPTAPSNLAAEVVYAAGFELACTVGDVLLRRTHLAFETRDHGRAGRPSLVVRPESEVYGFALVIDVDRLGCARHDRHAGVVGSEGATQPQPEHRRLHRHERDRHAEREHQQQDGDVRRQP